MQSSKIKVGEEYAHVQYKGATPRRVKVLETGVRQKSYNWHTGDRTNMVRIEVVGAASNAVRLVAPRTIIETWADYVPKRDAAEEQAKAHAALRAEARDAKWAKIATVDAVMADAGIEARPVPLVRDDEIASAQRAGFEIDLSEGYERVHLHGIDQDGKSRLDAVETLALRYTDLAASVTA